MFKYFIIIALVHWCAYESCFVVLVQASISLARVSGWTVTDYLFAAGWRLFKHQLLSASESGVVHCSFHYLISLLFEIALNKFTFHCEM